MAAILSYEASEYCIVGSCLNCKSYTLRRFVPSQVYCANASVLR